MAGWSTILLDSFIHLTNVHLLYVALYKAGGHSVSQMQQGSDTEAGRKEYRGRE